MAEVAKRERKWNPPKSKGARSKMPKSQFLLPSQRKFPYKKQAGGKWVVSCKGLRQAITRQAQHGYSGVYQKAKMLYSKYCKSDD